MTTSTPPSDAASTGLLPEVVDALYRALLGYPPDDEGMAYWCQAGDVDAVIEGLTGTDRFRERAARLSGGAAAPVDLSAAGTRLARGGGLVELVDPDPRVVVTGALDAVPWDQIRGDGPSPTVRVVGRYARALADEIRARGTQATVCAGTAGVEETTDVLVLTAGADLPGLLWAAPDVVRAVRERILVPVQLPADLPLDEQRIEHGAVRRALHALGFVEVVHLMRHRHGGEVVRLKVSHATAVAGVSQVVERRGDPQGRVPAATWMVGSRRATVGRG